MTGRSSGPVFGPGDGADTVLPSNREPVVTEPSASAFRAVMSRFATGVSVMTTLADGEPHGMTANAVSSLSLDPLLVLVCVEREAEMAQRVERGGVFALSFLPASAKDLSDRFADAERPGGRAQFDGVRTASHVTGSPVLTDALAWVDCEVYASHDGGDHVIVVGRVVALAAGPDDDALVYYLSGYGKVSPP